MNSRRAPMDPFTILTGGLSSNHDLFSEKELKRKAPTTTISTDNALDLIEVEKPKKKLKVTKSPTVPSLEATRVKKSQQKKKLSAKLEQINHFRNIHKIRVKGHDVPNPAKKFSDLKLPEVLYKNIQNCGFVELTPIQMQAIPILLKDREILAIAPTGSGKSAAFLIPLIANLCQENSSQIRAVVLSPTRELAAQIYGEALKLASGTDLSIHLINEKDKNASILKNNGVIDVLISTPARMIKLIESDESLFQFVTHLIVDECDHLFSESFRNQLGKIFSACSSSNLIREFFSATWSHDVEQFCNVHVPNHVYVGIGPKDAVIDLVSQELKYTGSEGGKLFAVKEMIRSGIEPPVLIFVETQLRGEELCTDLVHEGIKSDLIHSGKTPKERRKTIENFRNGHINILVCTSLLGRGLDFPDVKLVINYDFPVSAEHYIHSVGRTGRAGKRGRAVTFFTDDDKDNLRRIAHILQNSGCQVPSYLLGLKKSKKRRGKSTFIVPQRQSIKNFSRHRKEISKATHRHEHKKKPSLGRTEREGIITQRKKERNEKFKKLSASSSPYDESSTINQNNKVSYSETKFIDSGVKPKKKSVKRKGKKER